MIIGISHFKVFYQEVSQRAFAALEQWPFESGPLRLQSLTEAFRAGRIHELQDAPR